MPPIVSGHLSAIGLLQTNHEQHRPARWDLLLEAFRVRNFSPKWDSSPRQLGIDSSSCQEGCPRVESGHGNDHISWTSVEPSHVWWFAMLWICELEYLDCRYLWRLLQTCIDRKSHGIQIGLERPWSSRLGLVQDAQYKHASPR